MTENATSKKTAIVLIHGIGEQRPMNTLKNFTHQIWKEDVRSGKPERKRLWSKPDHISANFELRRLTTGRGKGPRIDFFEFYWAHLMQGTELADIRQWIEMLLVRDAKDIPKHLHKEYAALLILTGVVAGLVGFAAIQALALHAQNAVIAAAVISALLGVIKFRIALPVVGDAARYLSPTPRNVARRTAIREAGLTLLESLHKSSGEYDRIILVGHSLGTVIGYDLLRLYWASNVKRLSPPAESREAFAAACRKLETLSLSLKRDPTNESAFLAYREKQESFWRTLRTLPDSAWLISDFITIGSPLARGDVLMAESLRAFQAMKDGRELPTSPPVLEKENPPKFTYEADGALWLHHAAPFAAVRWTNVYFPVSWVLGGDVIAGPIRNQFGPGVRDIAVHTKRWFGLLSHTHYWNPLKRDGVGDDGQINYISALRRAVNFLGEDEKTVWGPLAPKAEIDAKDFSPMPPPA